MGHEVIRFHWALRQRFWGFIAGPGHGRNVLLVFFDSVVGKLMSTAVSRLQVSVLTPPLQSRANGASLGALTAGQIAQSPRLGVILLSITTTLLHLLYVTVVTSHARNREPS